MELIKMFEEIKEYHKKLGYDYSGTTEEERMEGVRKASLALFQEVAELVDSFPWKPWRKIENQRWNVSNAVEEIVDILFFLGEIMEAGLIKPSWLEDVFNYKLKENYERIDRGYNNKPEERG
jgi:hypothetical protein